MSNRNNNNIASGGRTFAFSGPDANQKLIQAADEFREATGSQEVRGVFVGRTRRPPRSEEALARQRLTFTPPAHRLRFPRHGEDADGNPVTFRTREEATAAFNANPYYLGGDDEVEDLSGETRFTEETVIPDAPEVASEEPLQPLEATCPVEADSSVAQCGNCAAFGHRLDTCIRVARDGLIHGCIYCNVVEHNTPACVNFSRDPKSQVQVLVHQRQGMPALHGADWFELLFANSDDLPQEYPWSQSFAKWVENEDEYREARARMDADPTFRVYDPAMRTRTAQLVLGGLRVSRESQRRAATALQADSVGPRGGPRPSRLLLSRPSQETHPPRRSRGRRRMSASFFQPFLDSRRRLTNAAILRSGQSAKR